MSRVAREVRQSASNSCWDIALVRDRRVPEAVPAGALPTPWPTRQAGAAAARVVDRPGPGSPRTMERVSEEPVHRGLPSYTEAPEPVAVRALARGERRGGVGDRLARRPRLPAVEDRRREPFGSVPATDVERLPWTGQTSYGAERGDDV